jgi:hypothetical protein
MLHRYQVRYCTVQAMTCYKMLDLKGQSHENVRETRI